MTDSRLRYKDAGVDRDAAGVLVRDRADRIRSTYSSRVIGDVGHFAGLFRLNGFRDPVLVSSIDGVGTKVLLASAAGRLEVAGRDAIVHGVNDVAVVGAAPLFALDYLAAAQWDPGAAAAILDGVTAACRDEGVALLGGETAQMPGVYAPHGLDVVACVVGVVERDEVCDGRAIRPGDLLLGMASDGPHTNGYTLVRALITQRRWSLRDVVAELGGPLGDALLAPHRSYRKPLQALSRSGLLRGAAHVTGGGIPGNLARILPQGCRARVARNGWSVPPIFQLIAQAGNVEDAEMYATFNMGLGMLAVVPKERAGIALDMCRANGTEASVVGEITVGEPGVDLL
ncbi:MAG: phosphoribosylformylglycinamidine cyclo-ligase [bacterium]